MIKMEKIKKEVLDFLFPIECLGCGKENIWLCHDCFSAIPFNPQPVCLFCRQPDENGRTCPECRKNFLLDACLSAGSYADPILEKLIKTCKYSFAPNLAPLIGEFILKYFEKNLLLKNGLPRHSLIIPIPLHQKRLNWRGFNQSELIAGYLAEKLGFKISRDLIRIKNNPPQAKLREEKRKVNIKNSFSWIGAELRGQSLILVDDVATTGSTMEEAARILKAAGAGRITALTAAN
jgi:ComF family protein